MNSNLSVRRSWPEDVAPYMVPMPDGWQLRAFDMPSKQAEARGSILFLGGRGDIPEKYLESLAVWRAAGWNVSGFDWRGQGGSGRLLADRSIGHIADFAQWIGDLATFFDAWRGSHPGPHVVIAHSMGGHLVLRALIEKRIAPDGAVLVSPMLGFDAGPVPVPFAAWLVKMAARLGRAEKPAWKANERPAARWSSRQKFLTHDEERYADEIWWKAQSPDLALGPPSTNWLFRASESCARIAVSGAPESVTTPMLVLGTDGDRLVNPKAIRTIAARLPNARLHMFGQEAAHEILREVDAVRDLVLAKISAFLNRVASAR